ncbi:hypothetical protein RO3G_01611 [Lichtheimia corymbifera JMRC:FSU:9682]|uniref:Reverse transcriptase domain-containing protein n=1 Tax=Lichtheimia corymbifera JMRC:FSU:9682 TaxID=1263082 RepID=A0A068S3Y8_9FUNG|nr:hypothetical protein RO3G_01611 [Lichtheimia corymbifera JMRC:FSU:9682]
MYPELNGMLSPPTAAPTYHRGNLHTTVDYIFCTHHLQSMISNAQQWHMSSAWTDHEMMTVDFRIHSMDTGPGCWRFNPLLLGQPPFDLLLQDTVKEYFTQLDDELIEMDPQACWDNLKTVLKETAIDYSFRQRHTTKQHFRALQRHRHVIIQQHGNRDPRLPSLEKEIAIIQERVTKQLLLRTATRWHEEGERNNKYFFKVLKKRQAATTIHHLRDPHTGERFTTMGGIMQHARHFYKDLYTPTEIDQAAVDKMLSSIPSSVRVTATQGDNLMRPFSWDELVRAIEHSPLGKSPGMDGLPFELLKHMQTWEPVIKLLLSVMNQALLHNLYPRSWLSTRMVLLFKKGDPQLLANWRPLSLINSDAKLFTKLLANRLQPIMPCLINPFQTGFLAKRLISDNGWVAQNLMHHVRRFSPSSSSVGVLLDQEKAYDRVHSDYLRQVMTRFGFPIQFIDSLLHLFFSTSISLSINGWLSSPVSQLRGLRQGDPISPLLFNLAFEPLIRTLLSDPLLLGSPLTNPNTTKWDHRIHFRTNLYSSHIPPIKALAYADDLLVFLRTPAEWQYLLQHLTTYNLASNGKVNLNKTVVFPLSGSPNPSWQHMLHTINVQWHDRTAPTALTYLGYPLYHHDQHLDSFLSSLYTKLETHVHMLQQRTLSILGKATVANSLLLSRLWHILRVCVVPQPWIQKCQTLIRKYVCNFFPSPSWSTCCLPRSQGGLGLVDIQDQHLALHHVYLQRVLHFSSSNPHPPFISSFLIHLFHLYTGQPCIYTLFLPSPPLIRLCSDFPHIQHLLQLSARLPAFPIDPLSLHDFLDIPFRNLTLALPESTTPLPTLKILVSNVYRWVNRDRKLTIKYATRIRQAMARVLEAVEQGTMTLHPTLQTHTTANNPLSSNPSLPDLTSWCLPSKEYPASRSTITTSAIAVTKAGPGQLRAYWRSTTSISTNVPSIAPYHWKRFWKLRMPHGSRTIWWRILQHHLSTTQHLHRLMPVKHPTPLCRLCFGEVETSRHMFLDCPFKRVFWIDALVLIQAPSSVTPEMAWHAILFQPQHPTSFCYVYQDRLGLILQTIWAMHWQCLLQATPWNHYSAYEYLDSLIARHPTLVPPIQLDTVEFILG